MILATVSSDPGFHKDVRASLDGHLRFEAAWDLGYEDAARLRGLSPEHQCILIVDFADLPLAMPVARAVDGRPQIVLIAVKGGGSREDLLQLMQAGVREVLPNFTQREIRQAAARAASTLATTGDTLADLYAFMPAKPGCGATTIATYATAMAAQRSAEPTLLLDFDIRLGVTSFLLKAEGAHTIVDALLQADRLDRGHLVQPGGPDEEPASARLRTHGFFAARLHRALHGAAGFRAAPLFAGGGRPAGHHGRSGMRDFAPRQADLSGLYARHRRSACGAPQGELAAGSAPHRQSIGGAQLHGAQQHALGGRHPAHHSIAGSPPAAGQRRARFRARFRKARCWTARSGLGKQIARIAEEMASNRPSTKKPSAVRRFVEYFSISAARDAR